MLRIRLSNATVIRDGRPLLNNASLTLEAGRHLAVLGPNGAGKTTLLRLLRGDIPPDAQESRIYETQAGTQSDPIGLRHRMAMVSGDMQDFYEGAGHNATGREIVLAGFFDAPLLYERPTAAMQRQADEALNKAEATDLGSMKAGAMSTGQLRRVLMARALAGTPKILLLDECLDGLDAPSRDTMLALLNRIAGQCTLVVTAHREEDIPEFVRETVHLFRSEITDNAPTSDAPPAQIALTPTLPEMDYLIRIRDADVITMGARILSNISFTMLPGEIWAISGRNGAGKSTLLKLILGDEAPYADEGTVERFGGAGTGEEHRRRMAVVSPEMHGLFAREPHCRDTVLETVLSGLFGTIGLYATPSREQKDRAREVLAFSGLAELEARRMESLSHGQRRRALLARAVAGQPWLLLLDEPMSGLDAPSREQMHTALDRLADLGMPMILVSHREEDLPDAVNRKLHLENGRIVRTEVIA